jgi:hypothetical protein
METLSFHTADSFGGLAETSGILSLEGDSLVLEFEMKDALMGVIRTGPRTVRLPVTDLAEVGLRLGWFQQRLVLRSRNLRVFADLPGRDGAELVLYCRRRDRVTMQHVYAAVQERLTSASLKRLDAEAERLRADIDSINP